VPDPRCNCAVCPLAPASVNTRGVPSRGASNPAIFLVGQCPGREEDAQGLSFCGPAGRELDACLAEAGIPSEVCRWGNCVRCRPINGIGGDRDPVGAELEACAPALWAEIVETRPKVVVALGAIAATVLRGWKTSVQRVRGEVLDLPVRVSPPPAVGDSVTFRAVCTYHPASILHSAGRTRASVVHDLRVAAIAAGLVAAPKGGIAGTYQMLIDPEEITAWVERAMRAPLLSVDLETAGEVWDADGRVTMVGMSYAEGTGVAIPLQHRQGPWQDTASQTLVLNTLRPLLEAVPVIGAHFAYDDHWLRLKLGITCKLAFDVLDVYRMLNMGRTSKDVNLQTLAVDLLGMPPYKRELDQYTGGSRDGLVMEEKVPLEVYARYCATDVDAALRLRTVLMRDLVPSGMEAFYRSFLLRVWALLQKMERSGIQVDREMLQHLESEFPAILTQREAAFRATEAVRRYEAEALRAVAARRLYERLLKRKKLSKDEQELMGQAQVLAGAGGDAHDAVPPIQVVTWEQLVATLGRCPRQLRYWDEDCVLSVSSPKQLVPFLYQFLALPMIEEDDTQWSPTAAQCLLTRENGGPSTEEDYLQRALDWARTERPQAVAPIEAILSYRTGAKTYSTWIKGMSSLLDPDGIVRTKFHLLGADTGRLSCSGPAMHQIPEGPVESLLVSRWAPIGGLIVVADESQVEMRLFAVLTGEPGLIEAYARGEDIHSFVATHIYGIPREEVTSELREIAKQGAFAIINGGGPKAVVRATSCTPRRAKETIHQFYSRFSHVEGYVEGQRRQVLTWGCVYTPTGRIRWIPEAIGARDPGLLARAERQAINTPIQGAASDLVLWAALRAEAELEDRGLKTKLVLQVHDDLRYDVYPGELPVMLPILRWSMTTYLHALFDWLTVPLDVGIKIGTSFGSLATVRNIEGNRLQIQADSTTIASVIAALGLHYRGLAVEEQQAVVEKKKEELRLSLLLQ